MRLVIQRVKSASVAVEGHVVGQIQQGLLVLLGIHQQDGQSDIQYLIKKLLGLRIFSDEAGKMNLSVGDINGEILLISQFTLYADTRKGNRPGFTEAAPPAIAIPLYELFKLELATQFGKAVPTGIFGADMQVVLTNDGPVTIIIDSSQAPKI